VYEKFQQNSGAWRGEIAEVRPVVIPREGRGPSIPEAPAIEPRSRGVLGRPIKSGDDAMSSWLFENLTGVRAPDAAQRAALRGVVRC
jgi:hypothetical protein